MFRWILIPACLVLPLTGWSWGFYAHKKINRIAVFLLPPEMLVLYKKHLLFIEEHAVDPDKRRYQVKEEGPRHYIDMDQYGPPPYLSLPRDWKQAVAVCGEDSLNRYGIVPWWIQTMLYRLTDAFLKRDLFSILKISAELGHYISDAHVPLHACSNHNGQKTNQRGIHGFWESRIPELLAESDWDFMVGKANWIADPTGFIWERVLQSAAAADTVLRTEKWLSQKFPLLQQYSFEERNGVLVKQYARGYALAYNRLLRGMIERRMQESIKAVASFWITAWVHAGQPSLVMLSQQQFTAEEKAAFELLQQGWNKDRLAYICPDDAP